MFSKIDLISRYYCNNVLPQIYGTSLSYPEQLCAVMKGINDVITRVNSFNEFIKEIYELLKDTEKTIKDEVIKIVNKMYEDGVFDEIFGDMIANKIPIKSTTLDMSLYARTITQALPDNATTIDLENYSFPQGGTRFSIGGVHYWVVAYLPHNGSHFEGKGFAQFNVYQEIGNNRLECIGYQVFGGVGHANGLCLSKNNDNGFSILVASSDNNTDRNIIELTFNTTDNKWNNTTITKTIVDSNIKYIQNICEYKGEHFILGDSNKVYKYNYDKNTIEFVAQVEYNANYSGAGLAIDDNYIYIGDSYNNSIAKCDRKTGAVNERFKIPLVTNGGMDLFGELENITVENNILYAVTGRTLAPKNINYFVKVCFWSQNLINNSIIPTNYYNGAHGSDTFFVTGDKPTSHDNATCPSGRLRADGFSSVQEAVDYGKWCKSCNTIRVNVYQPHNISAIFIDTYKPVFISGESYYSENNTQVIIGGIYCLDGQQLRLTQLGFNNHYPDDAVGAYGSLKTNIIYMLNGNLNCKDMYFPVGSVSNPFRITHAIYINGGNCNFYNSVFGTTEEQWNTRTGGSTLVSGNNATINGHGLLTKNINVIG